MEWETDILGDGFQAFRFQAAGLDGLKRTATLVRHVPADSGGDPARPDPALPDPPADPAWQAWDRQQHDGQQPSRRRVVLFLHGWSDYFFNVDLARFWADKGFEFFALDLHNHGRSLQPDTLGGYVADLGDYDAEIGHAISIIAALEEKRPEPTTPEPTTPQQPSLTLMGHSTGGLVAALWASRHPGVVSHLVLNSPWLEMHRSPLVRRAAFTMVEPLARFRPETVLRLPERGFYWRSISSSAEGEWVLDDRYRPPMAFPVRAGWLSAVLAGQSKVARGLRIEVPILVLLSGASANGMVWSEAMRRTDAVLDVNTLAVRAMSLGRTVTLERIDGALHDVFLSPPKVRADAYARLSRWIRGYVAEAGEAASTAPP